MIAALFTILTASIVGSLHCVGMCGPFVAFAAGTGPLAPRVPWRLHLAYNGGRLLTYTALGVAAGALGAMLDLGGRFVGVQRAAGVLAGALMVAVGLVALLRYHGVGVGSMQLPAALQRVIQRGHQAAAGLPPVSRAAVIGLLTTLLPCGWLYTFVIAAAGAGSPAWGGLTMAAFWLGTLPALLALGVGVQRLTALLGARLPLVTSVLVVLVGLFGLFGRLGVRLDESTLHATPSAVATASERIANPTDEPPPCCKNHGD